MFPTPIGFYKLNIEFKYSLKEKTNFVAFRLINEKNLLKINFSHTIISRMNCKNSLENFVVKYAFISGSRTNHKYGSDIVTL